jgi:GH24 family phage-related lysozyme (muramidase)
MRHTVLGDATIKVTGQYIEKAAMIHMNGPIPPDATAPQTYSIPTNTQITDAFVPVIPEHEPWAGHSGSINPKGPGSQQLKNDPAPKKVPQEPKPTDKGTPIVKTKEQDPADPKNIPVPVSAAKTSPEAVSCIRDKNDWRGYPYKDGDGTSVGYGSPVADNPAPSAAPITTSAGTPETTAESPVVDPHEQLTGEKSEPTQEQLNDANEVKSKKQEELSAKQADTKAKLAEVDGPGYAKTPDLSEDQRLAVIEDAKSKGIPVEQALNNSNIFGYGLPPTEEMKLRNEISASGRNSIPNENLYGGITKERSEQLLAQDISKSEAAVRSTLTNAGVQNVPPKVFDGLVSMHNQLGNVNYAFCGGAKISLTSMYQEGNWDRAASFIAADERDRPRRQAEANIMVNGDYGSPANSDQVIARGLAKTQSLYINNRLNEQTGNTTNYAQQQAAASSWYKMTGTSLPGLNFSSGLTAQQNVMSNVPANKRWGY